MVYVDSNNYIYITNLSSGLNVNTTLIFNNTSNNAYYGLLIALDIVTVFVTPCCKFKI